LEENGASFFCAARGKLGEGIDFKDSFGRAIIMIGMPNLNIHTKYYEKKFEYLNKFD
jgi:Rad3-related DNA helicase